MSTTALGLDVIWKFLEPILSDAVKERLKPKGSATIARQRAFDLYEVLGEVKAKTDEFVEDFRRYVEELQTSPSVDIVRLSSLRKVARELMDDLASLVRSLNKVNPQLEIHRNDIVEAVFAYRQSRAMLLSELEQSVEAVLGEELSRLRPLLERAETNRILIDNVVCEMRSFLKSEFSFKESF